MFKTLFLSATALAVISVNCPDVMAAESGSSQSARKQQGQAKPVPKRKMQRPARPVDVPVTKQKTPELARDETKYLSDQELARLNENIDQYLIVFSKAANIPKGQNNVKKAKSRAMRLSNRILRSAKVSKETRQSLEVTTGALNVAYVKGLTEAQIERIRRDRRVDDVEKDTYFRVYRDNHVDTNPASWGLDRIDQTNLPLNNEHSYSHKNTANIYVMDGGIDFTHPEFTGRTGDQMDFTGDTVPSCDNHGTHIAGTIMGSTYGIARNATIHDLKSFHCTAQYSLTRWFIDPINHVVNTSPGLSVINLSASYGGSNVLMINAVNNAVTQHNVVFVTSSGNITSQNTNPNACAFFPNSQPALLTVASSGQADQFSTFSKHGSCVDLSAPGHNIMSSKRFGTSGLMSGTSMAAPHVAGVAASIWMDEPTLTSQQVIQKVKDSATPNVLSGVPGNTPNLLAHYKPGVAPPNQPPQVSFNINWMTVYSGRPGVTLTAQGSTDPEGHYPLSYDWTETNHGFPVQDVETQTFTAPIVTAPTNYYFDLKVKDSLGLQAVGSYGTSMVVVPDACTVYDQSRLLDEFPIVLMGSTNSDFTLKANQAKLQTTITNYVTNAQSQNAQVSGAILTVNLKDMGTGATPSMSAQNIPNVVLHSASLNSGTFAIGNQNGPVSEFWTGTPLEIDRWYRLQTNLRPIHNGGGMNNDCTNTYMYFRLPTNVTVNGPFNFLRPVEIFTPPNGPVQTINISFVPREAIAINTGLLGITGTVGTVSQGLIVPARARLKHKATSQCPYDTTVSNASVRHWSCWSDPNMVFELNSLGNNEYYIKSEITGRCITGNSVDGGGVTHATCSNNTKFKIVDLGTGNNEVRLRHINTGKCLYATNINGDKTFNWGCWSDPNMVFILEAPKLNALGPTSAFLAPHIYEIDYLAKLTTMKIACLLCAY